MRMTSYFDRSGVTHYKFWRNGLDYPIYRIAHAPTWSYYYVTAQGEGLIHQATNLDNALDYVALHSASRALQ